MLAGLLALASVLVLSFFYYRIQTNSPFAYSQMIVALTEFQVLDSRINLPYKTEYENELPDSKDGEVSNQINNVNAERGIEYGKIKSILAMQNSAIEYYEKINISLQEKGLQTPLEQELSNIKSIVLFRERWLNNCQKLGKCNVVEWSNSQSSAWENCERLLSNLNSIISAQEYEWSRNLQIFYVLSVLLLLATLFFAAGKNN